MQRRMTAKQMMSSLKQELIHTWFDLGLFIDKFKENRPIPVVSFNTGLCEISIKPNRQQEAMSHKPHIQTFVSRT